MGYATLLKVIGEYLIVASQMSFFFGQIIKSGP